MKELTIAKKVITSLIEEHVVKWFRDELDSKLTDFLKEEVDSWIENNKTEIRIAVKDALNEAKKLAIEKIKEKAKDNDFIEDISERLRKGY